MVACECFRVIGADTTYKLTLKGYTVVEIDPQGEICPLYSRAADRGDRAPMKRATRVVPGRLLVW